MEDKKREEGGKCEESDKRSETSRVREKELLEGGERKKGRLRDKDGYIDE